MIPPNVLISIYPGVKFLVYSGNESEYRRWIDEYKVNPSITRFVLHSVESLSDISPQPIGHLSRDKEFWAVYHVGRYRERRGYIDFVVQCVEKNIYSAESIALVSSREEANGKQIRLADEYAEYLGLPKRRDTT